ncbi:MAG: cytochrome ubiquinol oxidase subunit I, partial [Streptosporangiaceae bacterium]
AGMPGHRRDVPSIQAGRAGRWRAGPPALSWRPPGGRDVTGHLQLIVAAVTNTPARSVVTARTQMAATLSFHIILACFGVAFPAVVLTAHYLGLRRHDQAALLLARRWSKVMAVLVAVGAVTGTVLSFEMGLLWPGLMGRFGGVIGIPFAVEGIFFFLEAVFTAIYLYGWDRLPRWAHFWTGVPVVISGILGALSVVGANSWMNQPGGFTLTHGKVTAVNPWAVIFNRAFYYEVPHMILAAYMVTGFLVAAVYAVGMLRGRRSRYHRLGLLIPFTIAAVATPLQIFVGDTAARAIAKQQPVKFAAMEYVVHTHRGVTEWIGGLFIHGQVYLGLQIPYFDSLLTGFSPHTKVTGWDSVPASDRPPAPWLIHMSFDTMVGLGFLMLAAAAWLGLYWWRRRHLPATRWFYAAVAACGPAAVIAMECGWIVTEVGRQPWVVYGYLTTSQAATTAGGVPAGLAGIIVLYFALGAAILGVIYQMSRHWQREEVGEHEVPYGPGAPAEPAHDRASP